MYRSIKIIIIAISLLGFAIAQPAQEISLKEISVEGNTITNTDLIIFTAGLKEGHKIQAGDFSRAIKQLWKSGLFEDVQVNIEEESEEDISIIIAVVEAPALGEIIIKGDKKLSKTKIKEKISLISGQRIRDFQITEAKNNVKDLYTEEGYLLAEITTEVTPLKPDSTANQKKLNHTRDLVFNIKENQKVKIGIIEFTGNENYSDIRLRLALKKTKQQRWYMFWRSAFDETEFENDKDKIQAFYQKRGYRDAMVTTDSIAYSEDKKKMNLWLTVHEGPQYYYRNFSWEGNEIYTNEQMNKALGIHPGEAYNEEDLQKGLYERAQALYMDRGYIYSQITPEIVPVGNDSLDINLTIVENHKVFVRNIYISGNTRTRENVIRRELKLYPGDVFSRQKLIRSQREVWILNYFGNVVPDVLPVSDDKVDLEIVVEEKSSERANLNIGYTEQYGITGGGGLEFMNFRGLGQSFLLSATAGLTGSSQYNYYDTSERSKYRSFSLSFTDPMIKDTPNLVGGSLFYSFRGQSNQYYYPLDLQIMGGSLMWGRRFRWPDDFFRGRWGFQVTKKVYDGTQENLDLYTGGLAESVGVNISQSITRDSRDRPEFTTSGSRMVWNTTVSGGLLGGNEDFHKHELNLEWFTPVVSKLVLMSSLKLGVIEKIQSRGDEISIIPFDERFIMGGNGIPYGNMLRGYADNSLGPRSSSGSPIGGNSMLRFVTELRFPLSQNPVIYMLAFAEMGNVWANKDMTEPFYLTRSGSFNLKRSMGVGVRFFMPMIGMLGFDIGYGFDDVTGDGEPNGWKTTITFGQQF